MSSGAVFEIRNASSSRRLPFRSIFQLVRSKFLPHYGEFSPSTLLLIILLTRRRSVNPTAIGLMRPSFFASGVSDAPTNRCRKCAGTLPCKTKLQNLESECRSLAECSLFSFSQASFKCCGDIPSKPPADHQAVKRKTSTCRE